MKSAEVLLSALLLAVPGAVLGATVRRLGQRPYVEGRDGRAGVGTHRRQTPVGRRNDGGRGGGPSAYLRSERDRRRGEAGRSENDRGSTPDEDDEADEGPRENNGNGVPTAAVALTRDGRSSLLSAGVGDASILPVPPDLDDPRKAASELRLSDAFGRLPDRPPHARRGLSEPNCHMATKLWHPDAVYKDGCTDDGNHVPGWLNNFDGLFFESAEECCSSLFSGRGCEVRGPFCVKDGGEDGGEENGGGVGGSGGCTATEHGWHADSADKGGGCTNDDDFPSAWLATKSLMFFETAEGCCDMFNLGKTCNKRDCSGSGSGGATTDGGGVSPGTTGGYGDDVVVVEGSGLCEADGSGHGWHADMFHDGCSNDSNFPKEWLGDVSFSHMLHPNPSDCCKAFFPGMQCMAYDSGNDEPPAAWDDATLATVTYDSAADCCQVHHSGWTCAVRDHCSKTGVEYLSVTARPTDVPTLKPSTEAPTPSPVTLEPTTAMPTNSPTSVWYVDHFTGVCHHTATPGVVMPHYIDNTYGDAGECCESSFDSEKCKDALPEDALMEEGTPEPTPSPLKTSPIPTPSPKYYVDHFSQTCITAGSETMPHWIRDDDKFDDPVECCKSVPAWWEEQCLEKSVRVTPTWHPTYSPTQFFTGPPTDVPSNAPSYLPTVITESPTDGCTDLTWRYTQDRVCTNRPRNPTEPAATFLFETAAECCHAMFFAAGLTGCHVDDACMKEPLNGLRAEDFGGLKPSPSCVGDGALMGTTWHPDPRSMDGCTNTGDVPATWKRSDNELFFGSPFDCCSSLYMNRESNCFIRDSCLVWNGRTPSAPSSAVIRSPTHPPRTEEPSVREAVSVVNTDELCASAVWYLDFDA
ncbi:hypothetical protein THAOC_34398, partial [Thalassiosira oceanica]